jgi:hypothetical protein
MWVGTSDSWERRRLGGSLSNKTEKGQYRMFCPEIATAGKRPAGRRFSQGAEALTTRKKRDCYEN